MKALFLLLFLSVSLTGASFAAASDRTIEPTHWGKVIGDVYAARTGQPIRDAVVCIQQDGVFPEKGRTVGKTDAIGRYECEAMLGRVSSNVDVGRLLGGGIISILGGGWKKETKRIDITRLNVRVEHAGYHPFEGVVLCQSADPFRFGVTMEPILLAEAGSAECSTAADGWGRVRIVGVSVEPAILRPGAKATVSVQVQSPPVARSGDLRVLYASPLTGKKAKWLKAQDARASGGSLVYTGDFVAPRSAKTQVAFLTAVVLSPSRAVAVPDGTSEAGRAFWRRQMGLVQVIATEAEAKTAETRLEAYRFWQAGDNAAAATRLKALCELRDAPAWDLQMLGEVSQALNDPSTAVTVLKRLVDTTPPKEQLAVMGDYATALLAKGDDAAVLRECAPLVDSIQKKQRPKKVALPLMLAIGRAHLKMNQMDQAAAISEELLKWPFAGAYPGTAEFRSDLRLAQVQAKLKANPGSAAARAEYARVLMDLGRWEEAVVELRAALNTDPDLPAGRRDLAYALLHLKGDEAAVAENLDQARAAAERQVEIADGKKTAKSKDFFAWHSLAILRYRKACQQQEAADPGSAAMFAASQEAFREALRCGRSGADVYQGAYNVLFGYTSPRIVAISGFAYPQANSDFVMLESLKALEKNPNDYLAEFNLGVALLDLGQPESAAGPIQKTLALKPDFVEARYADALLAMQRQDRAAAKARLQEVTRANPRHPHAWLKLAQLQAEAGDTAAAATCLAAHSQVYGTTW